MKMNKRAEHIHTNSKEQSINNAERIAKFRQMWFTETHLDFVKRQKAIAIITDKISLDWSLLLQFLRQYTELYDKDLEWEFKTILIEFLYDFLDENL